LYVPLHKNKNQTSKLSIRKSSPLDKLKASSRLLKDKIVNTYTKSKISNNKLPKIENEKY
jgi:hypothetical protein